MKSAIPPELRNKANSRFPQSLLLLFSFLAASIVVGGFLTYHNHEQVHRTEVGQQLSAIAELKVSELTQYRRERIGDACLLFDNASLTTLLRRYINHPEDPAHGQELQEWLLKLQSHYQYDQIRFLDTNGTTLLSVPKNLGPPSVGELKMLSKILQSGLPALSDFYRSSNDKRVHLALSIPILDLQNGNRALGLLSLRITPEQYLYPFLQRWPIPSRTAETLLVRREGQEVIFLNELKFRKNSALNLRFPLSKTDLPAVRAALGQTGIITGRDYRGEMVIADVRPIPDSPWFLVSKMDTSEAYAPLREGLRTMAGLIGLLLFSLGAVMALVWQRQRADFYRKQHATVAALNEIETRYQHLYESMTDAFVQTDMSGEIVSVNHAFLDMMGYSEEEALNRTARALTPEHWHAMEQKLIETQVLPLGASELYEKEYIKKDGTVFPIELKTYLLRDSQGRPFGMWAIVRDISERKEVERKLKNLNRVYAVSSNLSQAAVLIHQPGELFQEACRIMVEDGGFLMAWISKFNKESGAVLPVATAGRNDGYVERLCITLDNSLRGNGPSAEAIRTARHTVCNDIEQDKRMEPWRHDALARGYRSSAGFPLVVFGEVRGTINIYAGEANFFNTEETRLLDELALNLSHALEFHEQEQARIQAEAALRESQQLFASIANTSPALIWMSGLDKGCIWFNEPWLACTGRTMEEELGDGWLAGVHPDDLAHCLQIHTEAFDTRKSFAMQYRLRRHDGEYRWILTQGQPRCDASGAFAGFIGSCLDISEHRNLENQIRHAVKMESIGTLAGGVAHDFNNILTAIIGYGQLALMDMDQDAPLRQNIEPMLEAANRATHLTKDLLLFSRKQITERKPVDLIKIINGIKKFIIRVIGEDITCETKLPEHPLTVLADSHQMEQVLMNFATNARHAMPKGGIFSITAEQTTLNQDFIAAHGLGRPGPYAVLTVSDNGCGMDEHIRERIFEPFFTTKEMGKGTGLGLAVVYGIIKQHEGYITVYSEPDMGTTFRLYLPLVGVEAPEEKIPAKEETPVHGTETILLAEDDNSVRTFAKKALTKFGYTVIEAVDGEEAVQKFRENQTSIQLLLSDIIMPKMNGQEVYEAISKIRPGIKAIFMSGYAPDMIRKKAAMGDTAPLLAKPLSPAKLLKKVRETLDQ